MSGHATIDSVRAAFNANETLGLDVDARYAMWGYSGGALASEWAAELQVQYAPEVSPPVPRLSLSENAVPAELQLRVRNFLAQDTPLLSCRLTSSKIFRSLITILQQMNFSGAALGGLTPNVTSVLYSINKGYAVGLAPVSVAANWDRSTCENRDMLTLRYEQSSILGLSSQYPDEKEYLLSRLKTEGPFNATGFLAALSRA
jgi:hypothetical protein